MRPPRLPSAQGDDTRSHERDATEHRQHPRRLAPPRPAGEDARAVGHPDHPGGQQAKHAAPRDARGAAQAGIGSEGDTREQNEEDDARRRCRWPAQRGVE
jgi:hypothetical protein